MSEREAQELIAKADKKAASSSWFFGGNKYEEAAELYTKAGNIYKMAKRCRSSRTSHHICTEATSGQTSRHRKYKGKQQGQTLALGPTTWTNQKTVATRTRTTMVTPVLLLRRLLAGQYLWL